jgi:hypothetical protein
MVLTVGSGRVREYSYEIEKCWMTTPSRVGLNEDIFDFDIGGSNMIYEIVQTLVFEMRESNLGS